MKKVILFSKNKGDTYGAELSNPTNWIIGTGATKVGETIEVLNSPTSTFVLLDSIGAIDGKTYKVVFEIYDYVQGELRIGQPFLSATEQSNGTFTFIDVKSTGSFLGLRTLGVSTFKIRNISIKERL